MHNCLSMDSQDLIVNMKCEVCGLTVPPFSGSLFLQFAEVCKLGSADFAAHLCSLSQQEAELVMSLRSVASCPHIRQGTALADAHWAANGKGEETDTSLLFTEVDPADEPTVAKLLVMLQGFSREQLVRGLLRLFAEKKGAK